MNKDQSVTFVNLTPHMIHLPSGPVEPCGVLARCAEETVPVGAINGIPIVVRRYGKVENLPEPHIGLIYIVSHMARVACPDRLDLVSPGDLTRDEKGNITGCTNLVINTISGAEIIRPVGHWIPIGEALPDHPFTGYTDYVLVLLNGDEWFKTEAFFENGDLVRWETYESEKNLPLEQVTHWMRIEIP